MKSTNRSLVLIPKFSRPVMNWLIWAASFWLPSGSVGPSWASANTAIYSSAFTFINTFASTNETGTDPFGSVADKLVVVTLEDLCFGVPYTMLPASWEKASPPKKKIIGIRNGIAFMALTAKTRGPRQSFDLRKIQLKRPWPLAFRFGWINREMITPFNVRCFLGCDAVNYRSADCLQLPAFFSEVKSNCARHMRINNMS